jgi:hypothetical protein
MTEAKTITTRQAAALIGVSPDSLKRWRHLGRGPAHQKLSDARQGRCIYLLAEIEKWQRDPQGYERRRQKNARHR